MLVRNLYRLSVAPARAATGLGLRSHDRLKEL